MTATRRVRVGQILDGLRSVAGPSRPVIAAPRAAAFALGARGVEEVAPGGDDVVYGVR